MRYKEFIVLLLAALVLSACSGTAREARKRYFWPPLTNDPKIEYIDYFQTDYDVKKKKIGAIEEAIFGRERPTPLFQHPFDVYSDGEGVFFVTEAKNGYVRVIDLVNGDIDTLKDRKGLPYPFKSPAGLTGDRRGRIFVVDSKENEILVFGPDRVLQDKWTDRSIVRPLSVAIDEPGEKLYVVDPGQHQVVVFSALDGQVISRFGRRGEGPGEFNFPLDVDVDPAGNVLVLDSLNARVQRFDADGRFLNSFGERGTALGSFQLPKSLAVSAQGHVYVTDSMAHRVVIFDEEGNYLMTVGGKSYADDKGISPGGFYLPGGIDVDRTGAIWVVDTLNRLVHRFQYLTPEYLDGNPVLPGQAAVPVADDK